MAFISDSLIDYYSSQILYGLSINTGNNKLSRLTMEGMDAISEAATPGRFLVDSFPIRGSALSLSQSLLNP